MNLFLPCSCGRGVNVHEGHAGMDVVCSCGEIVVVPRLGELRRMKGEGAVSPRLMIEAMVAKGELPATGDCSGCAAPTPEVIDVWLIESATERGGVSFLMKLFGILVFGWIGLLLVIFMSPREIISDGREVRMPVRICAVCRRSRLRAPPTWPIIFVALLIVLASGWASVQYEEPAIVVLVFLAAAVLAGIALALQQWRHRRDVRRLLFDEPIYRRLLGYFPNARIQIVERERPAAK